MKSLKIQDYIIIDTPFEFGVFKIENAEQLEQVQADDGQGFSKFLGTSEQADEIISLQNMLYRITQNKKFGDTQRFEQLKSNIKMMINKYKGL